MLTLIVEQGGARQTFTFDSEDVLIGRDEACDLRIASQAVSPQHCRIEALPNGHKLVDLKSATGTRVNGSFASQCRLNLGDRLDVGPVTIWFEAVPPHPAEEANAGAEIVLVTTQANPINAAALRERLQAVLADFRRVFGDERGLLEVESAVNELSSKIFSKPAFARLIEAYRLADITRAMTSTIETPKLLALILDAAVELTDSERGFILLRSENGEWKVRASRNFDHEAVKAAEGKISHGIAEQVAKSGQPVMTVDALDDERFRANASVLALKLRSIICLPLSLRGDVIGTLYLDNRFKNGLYGERERSLLSSFADQAAIAIENARLFEAASNLASRTKELEAVAKDLVTRLEESRDAEPADFKPQSRTGLKYNYDRIVGTSPAMLSVLQMLDRVIGSDLPVLITGESGTGKELIARAIHENSLRAKNHFVRENCAAIPENLLESELFGYRKGAFTGANNDKKGLFEEADGGTIFLDEIGEMSFNMQAKLMRVLQDGEIRSVGARSSQRVNVRLISATNRDLRRMAAEGKFREDLFFRLNVVSIHLPPLRERIEDLPLLVSTFLAAAAERTGQPQKSIDAGAMRCLMHHHWPGNIRELQNEIQRAVALSGDVITADDLSDEITAGRSSVPDTGGSAGGLKELAKLASSQKERELVLQALEQCNWRKSAAARKLGISRPTLDQKIKQFALAPYIDRGRRS